MNPAKRRGVVFAILAAAFYALNSPLSKLLLQSIPPTMMAAFLYLGAGLGMAVLQAIQQKKARSRSKSSPGRNCPIPWA